MTIKELRLQLGQLQKKMTDLQKKADDEKRRMTKEEDEQWNVMDKDYNQLRDDILKRETMEKREAELNGMVTALPPEVRTATNEQVLSTEERTEKANQAFRNWIRFGFDGLPPDQRSIMASRRASIDREALPPEVRAQSTTTTAGGYLIPQGFSNELDMALKAYGGMRQIARVFPTPDGRDIPWPTVDDTANVGEIVGENNTHNAQDVAFGQVILKAFKYSSKYVLVSVELLQDSFFNVEQLLAELLATRIGRITNTHFTTGASPGTATPFGVVAQAGVGKAGANGQTTTIIYNDLLDLEHSLDPAYRPGARWMAADSTIKALKKLVDGSSRPLWQPALSGLAGGPPDSLLGYPYTINQDVAAMGASAKSLIFGNFSKYIIRDARDVTILRLVERFAEFGQVAFLAFSRHDGRCINTAAFKYYANSAT